MTQLDRYYRVIARDEVSHAVMTDVADDGSTDLEGETK